MDKILVSVIIVLHNSQKVIGDSIRALDKSEYEGLEIILVDNASEIPADKLDLISRHPLRIITNNNNEGFGKACNIGARAANGEYYFFLNPDARPSPDAIGKLVNVFEDCKQAAVAGPQLYFEDGRIMQSYRNKPNFKRLLFSRNSPLSKLPFFSKLTEDSLPPPLKHSQDVDIIPGTAMMVKKGPFREAGGFDERFFLYAEDYDLCVILNEKGYRIIHQPDASVYHIWAAGSDAAEFFRVKEHNRSIMKYYRKHFPDHTLRTLILSALLSLRKLYFSIRY
ncbi:MAG: glycosyltransferase [candidate division Zixibacteria bacterium]|nr:glycosyltransferase [candidate division Zixibacteria bacterium]